MITEASPTLKTERSSPDAPRTTVNAVVDKATPARSLCCGARVPKKRPIPKARAIAAMKNMLTMFAPNMLPTASPGWSLQAAVMLAISSGMDVAAARSMVPTHSWPPPFPVSYFVAVLGQHRPAGNYNRSAGKEDEQGYGKVAHERTLL